MELKERINKLEAQQVLRFWRVHWYDFDKPSTKFYSDEYASNLYSAKKLSYKKVVKKYPGAQFWKAQELNKKEESEHIKESTQSLFRSGNEKPSEALKQKGYIYGFSSLKFAQGWKKKNNFKYIYQFMSSDYKLDSKVYIRDTDTGKEYNDNEYICMNVVNEKRI